MGALTKGALVDTFKRFPTLAAFVKFFMHYQIAALINDTNTEEVVVRGTVVDEGTLLGVGKKWLLSSSNS